MAGFLLFDLYGTLVDPLAIAAELDVLGVDGSEVARLWRLKQLEYSFRLTVMGQYQDFRQVTSRALAFALASAGVSADGGQLRQILAGYDRLPAFADAEPALQALADAGCEMAVLSNGTPGMIRSCLASSGLDDYLSRAGQRGSGRRVQAGGGGLPVCGRPARHGPPGRSGWCQPIRSTAPAGLRPGCGRPG